MPNLNSPSLSAPEVPGIDDCDYLYTCCSRDGRDSIYLRCQEFEHEGKIFLATSMSYDFDSIHDCGDLPAPIWVSSHKQAVMWLIETARAQFGKGNFVKCTATRELS